VITLERSGKKRKREREEGKMTSHLERNGSSRVRISMRGVG